MISGGNNILQDSFIKWMGGKSQLRKEIIPLIPPHKTYVEPFGGAGWVLFGKPQSPVEFFNDIDNDLINLYLVIRDNLDDFIGRLNNIPISEVLYNGYRQGIPCRSRKDLKKAPSGIPSADLDSESVRYTNGDHGGIPSLARDGIPSVDQAIGFYYILTNSFNGKLAGTPTFAVTADRESSFMRFYTTDWEIIQARLRRITILNRDFADILKSLDRPETFFYLDPPYICATNNNRYYRYTFSREDHSRLLVYLNELQGKFLLSYGNTPEILEDYSDFTIIESKITPGELFILNYEPPKTPFYSTCSNGIPTQPGIPRVPEGGVYQGSSQRASWKEPNCPECGGRFIKQLYERVTLTRGGRSFVANGYTCKGCNAIFKIPVDQGGIPTAPGESMEA